MTEDRDQQHLNEVLRGERFEFGKNWSRFLRLLNEDRIIEAERALREMLEVDDLRGKTFLDIGSGSGLMSLVARRLGARVRSFDYDPRSVACTEALRARFFPDDPDWQVSQGSVLDASFMDQLGSHDVVYSWGVLHHTGQMWTAIDLASRRVAPNGSFFIAIYNDQGAPSRYWRAVKRLYNRGPLARLLVTVVHIPNVYLARYAVRLLTRRQLKDRGMSLWYDMIDWLGGYPFEVATPESILEFLRGRGFFLSKLKTCRGRYGCNEFVFQRTAP
jgi:2-polyprenyl-3-methyl-5-hydroxy-6-metoxy-1,4-benzoquinol methylase